MLFRSKSNKSVLDQRGSISADPLFLNTKLIDNQIALLKSFAQIRLIIENLDFEVSYYAKSKYIWEEIYKRSPFEVNPDSGHARIRSARFNIRILDRERFSIWSEKIGAFSNPRTLRFGEQVTGKDYSFTVTLKEGINAADYSAQEYGFEINDILQLTSQYRNKTNISQEKGASVVIISSSGPNKDKEKDYLNELTRMFLITNLEKKNRILTKIGRAHG